MGSWVDVTTLAWQPVRPDVARGVYGRTVLSDGVKVVLTRVAPGGGFSAHRDGYDHLFYVLAGQGLARVEEEEFPLRHGMAVRIAAGETHAYENTGAGDLTLLSLNLPPR